MNIENTSVRLKQLMQERKLRQVDLLDMVRPFCEKYNVKMNKSDISQYLSGTVKPGQEKLSMLGMALNVNEAWLMGYDVPMEKIHYIEALESIKNDKLSKEEIILLENYNKLNSLGKKEANKRVAELTLIPTYTEIKNNVTELITATTKKEPQTLNDLDITTLAAHDDNLTEEEKVEVDKRILEALKKRQK
ncbi:transcriptional regulator [Clostridium sp. C2-6-12]|uniref:transcriptional regulator n=1 Tax=Clostridium sp. C2-6-12 TaxID=2698832 RepID=UPI001FAB5BC2|nr:transcriptional regulator [Clostridium sp. C2-6-12]